MRRIYMPADARTRQLERMIRRQAGMTLNELAHVAKLSYRAAAAYASRLEREGAIEIVIEEPGTMRGCRKRLYPKAQAEAES
jgi:hypothetical protein